jgi:hypothetical protein
MQFKGLEIICVYDIKNFFFNNFGIFYDKRKKCVLLRCIFKNGNL